MFELVQNAVKNYHVTPRYSPVVPCSLYVVLFVSSRFAPQFGTAVFTKLRFHLRFGNDDRHPGAPAIIDLKIRVSRTLPSSA